ncbi:transcription antitermination factor NusB [Oscillospiraceae bacterium MB08-C2-2]|nr:transcription antitermination factor NusB [Oscillospiraceae bacterium MB08-C2-2]
MKRRDSRETAFALLFEWSFKDDTLDQIIEQAELGRNTVVDPFAYQLASTAIENCTTLDILIQKFSQKWKLSRLSKVTLAILRLSVCEITLMEDIPVGASINEAVELSKKFSTEDEAAFVNGVLGGIARELNVDIAAEDILVPEETATVQEEVPSQTEQSAEA